MPYKPVDTTGCMCVHSAHNGEPRAWERLSRGTSSSKFFRFVSLRSMSRNQGNHCPRWPIVGHENDASPLPLTGATAWLLRSLTRYHGWFTKHALYLPMFVFQFCRRFRFRCCINTNHTYISYYSRTISGVIDLCSSGKDRVVKSIYELRCREAHRPCPLTPYKIV